MLRSVTVCPTRQFESLMRARSEAASYDVIVQLDAVRKGRCLNLSTSDSERGVNEMELESKEKSDISPDTV